MSSDMAAVSSAIEAIAIKALAIEALAIGAIACRLGRSVPLKVRTIAWICTALP